MQVLVVGGNGFIGHSLVRKLTAAHFRVTVCGRKPMPARALPPGAIYVAAPLGDSDALIRLVGNADLVVHLASATVPGTGDSDPRLDVEINLVGTLNLLEAMRQTGRRRLLFLSSGGTVYGIPKQIPIPETHDLAPISSYGVVKVAIESYLRLYERQHGLLPVIIRPSNPYGPMQGNIGVQGIIGTFLARAATGQPAEIWGDGTVVRDYLFVDDLADLCIQALESDLTGAFNGGSGAGTSVIEIVNLIREVTGRELPILFRAARKSDVPSNILDIRRARTDLGWQPQTPLRDGVDLTWRALVGSDLDPARMRCET